MIRGFFIYGYQVMTISFLTGAAAVLKLITSCGLSIKTNRLKIRRMEELREVINSNGINLWTSVQGIVDIYVDKTMCSLQVLNFNLSTVDKLSGQVVAIDLILVAAAVFLQSIGICGEKEILSTLCTGGFSILIMLFVDKSANIQKKLEKYRSYLKFKYALDFINGDIKIQTIDENSANMNRFYIDDYKPEGNIISRWKYKREHNKKLNKEKKEIFSSLKKEEKRVKRLQKNKKESPREMEKEAIETMRKSREERKRERRERTMELLKYMKENEVANNMEKTSTAEREIAAAAESAVADDNETISKDISFNEENVRPNFTYSDEDLNETETLNRPVFSDKQMEELEAILEEFLLKNN